jgi:UDP-N-acetylglucosamine:LPS N-acetylglucosamine transferase
VTVVPKSGMNTARRRDFRTRGKADDMRDNAARSKVLMVSSGGGHWVQLLRVVPAFAEHEIVYVTVNAAYRGDVGLSRFYAINDATRWNKLRLIQMALRILLIMIREKPDIIMSTGAAPGYLALRMGRSLGIRTAWIDSIANVEELSLSGLQVGPYADVWLTQWPHLARPEGPYYAGAVL